MSVSGTYDYITIDLKGYLYTEVNEELNDSNIDCSQLNYEDCICTLWTLNQDTDENECLIDNHNNNCYWLGSQNSGACYNEQYSNVTMDLESWCSGNGESASNDIVIILEYEPLSNDDSSRLLELYSTDEDYLYNNPYIYLNYDVEENEINSINRYEINSISSQVVDNLLCSGGDCLNLNSNNEEWGTCLLYTSDAADE